MKRWLIKLVLFLLLGAVVNVAVAWGLILWMPMTEDIIEISERHWPLLVPDAWPPPYFGSKRGGCGWEDVRLRSIKIYVNSDRGAEIRSLLIWTSGFPAYSMRAENRRSYTTSSGNSEEWRYAWHKPAKLNWMHVQRDRLLPLRPIWPGFAINTVLYATVLWLLTLGPFTARRMIRSKRGLCIKCGYDLRGAEHDVCPECGVETRAIRLQLRVAPATSVRLDDM